MQNWIVYAKRADFAQMAQKYKIDPVTARILRNRDIVEEEQIRRFLKGGLADLYDPHLLKDGDLLCDLLLEQIEKGKNIRVIGDYDIDGVMSSYILVTALKRMGAKVSVQIPHRMQDGYGLNETIIENAHREGIDTILTCDNGIAAMEEIALAKSYGMTVLVTDHHEIPYDDVDGEKVYRKSRADAIVNPHQVDCAYPFKHLCGAGVAWKIVCLAYEKKGIPMEEAYQFLEQVAFATVGDIMSLTDENRILVKEGLLRIRHTQNVGLKALIQQCGILQENVEAYHFGFVLGPCINASGRLDTAQKSLELLFSTNPMNAQVLAAELVALNEERKELTVEGVQQAVEIYEEKKYENMPVLVIYLPNLHESIAGIVAGRIKEKYQKPTFILTKGQEGVKGSGRSIEAYSMWEEMTKCKELFTKYGGHPMAAGLSLPEENVDVFREKINALCSLSDKDFEEKIYIDVPMPLEYASIELVKEFQCLQPFGRDNTKPLFADKGIRIRRMSLIGKNKNVLKLDLWKGDYAFSGICFRDVETFLEYYEQKYSKEEVQAAMQGRNNDIEISMIYVPTINTYQDRESLQIEILHYK